LSTIYFHFFLERVSFWTERNKRKFKFRIY